MEVGEFPEPGYSWTSVLYWMPGSEPTIHTIETMEPAQQIVVLNYYSGRKPSERMVLTLDDTPEGCRVGCTKEFLLSTVLGWPWWDSRCNGRDDASLIFCFRTVVLCGRMGNRTAMVDIGQDISGASTSEAAPGGH